MQPIFLFGSVVLALLTGGCASSAMDRSAAAAASANGASSTTNTTNTNIRASTLAEGALAPDFVGPAPDGKNVSLAALRGRTVVLFFYTRDETPNAVREAIDFRDAYPKLRQQGIAVVGVSTDTIESHKEFAERLHLPFSLVSDTEGVIARAFGVPDTYGIADRRTFVIGPDGTVEKVFEVPKVDQHVAEVADLVAHEVFAAHGSRPIDSMEP